jgi:hypothetical protein
MRKLWFAPLYRNITVHGFSFLMAAISTIFVNYQFNQELNACKTVKLASQQLTSKSVESRCNKLFENLEKDLDPWLYVLFGFNAYILLYGWASGNVSVLTAMETKPEEDHFEIKKPYFIDEELFKFGFYFAKVLKSQTQLVSNPKLVFFDDFFCFKYTGFVKRDLVVSALLASYPYLEVKTQDSLRSVLKDITINPSDRFDVSEIAFQFLAVSGSLGHKPTMKLLKKVALSKALITLNSPDQDSLDKVQLPPSLQNSNFSDPTWLTVYDEWTTIAKIGKTEIEVAAIYNPATPIIIGNLQEAQKLFNDLFTK